MPEIKIRIPDELPPEIAKFELEKELNLKANRLRSIREAIKSLGLEEEDLEKFETARQRAWEKTKRDAL
ncbi:MAG: hypothetical protein ACLFVX_09090 [Archaeoglobaceae archaeon]